MPILDNLANTALNLGTVLVVLVALVVAHEFGHFVVARLADVRVHEFGIGLPPRALTYHRGKETAYTLNWLPLGGFVRLEGEDGDSADPRSFSRKSLPVRTVILVAGVIMNFLVAWLIFSLIAGLADPTVGIRVNAFAPTTSSGQVSPAETAGLTPAQVTGNDANGPIYDDSGDVILAIDGQTFNWFDAGAGGAPDGGIRYLRAHAGQTVTLTVRHADGTVSEVPVTLNTADVAAKQGALGIRNYGFIPGSSVQRGPLEALQVGFQRTVQASMLVLNALRDLVSNLTNPQVAGPIGIVKVMRKHIEHGPRYAFWIVSAISIYLGLFNLLPLPGLDGGRLVFLGWEAISRRRVNQRIEQTVHMIGVLMLLTLIVVISFKNDLGLGRLFRH